MKTNLLAQNDSLVVENLKANVGRSVENLSHSVTFPIDPDGAILPICCIETVPSDAFEISVECLLRQISSLKVPIMTNLRLNTAFYYCDNRLAWKKWDRFMTGGRSGNEVFDIPRVANYQDWKNDVVKSTLLDVGAEDNSDGYFSNIHLNNTLHTYLGISMNHSYEVNPDFDNCPDDSDELPVAFAEFDYQIICRDFYTNIDRLPQHHKEGTQYYNYDDLTSDWAYDNLFPSDDDEIRLKDGIQVKSGFNTGDDYVDDSLKGFLLDKVRYHDVRPDYFTSSKKAPMRGDAPSITTTTNDLKLPSGASIKISGSDIKAELKKDVFDINSGTYVRTDDFITFTQEVGGDTAAYAISTHLHGENNSDSKPYVSQSEVNGTLGSDIGVIGTVSTDITAADIRLLSQLTVWQELNMLHEPYYNDFLNAHFDNVRVGESPVEKPQYIGGTSQIISINEILQTSASSGTSYLGNQGATAMSLASNYVGKYYANNYGYIIGVAYIVPDMLYKPAMPRGFSRRTKEDFYSPEFANLSMQATLNKEIFYSNDDNWNNLPWGYTGAFDEFRSIPNRIAGDLLNSNYTDLQKWVLTRNMSNDNKPSMESIWLSLKDNVDYDAWNVTTMPKFMLQVANYIKAVRPMPKVAIPKAL